MNKSAVTRLRKILSSQNGDAPMGSMYHLHGLNIGIENPKDSIRSSKPGASKPWQSTMQDHYGFIEGFKGADKDSVDAFVNPALTKENQDKIHIVSQVDPETGKFDEHKVMFGYADAAEAEKCYLRNYQTGWKGCKKVSEVTPEELLGWLKSGDKKTVYVKKRCSMKLKKCAVDKLRKYLKKVSK